MFLSPSIFSLLEKESKLDGKHLSCNMGQVYSHYIPCPLLTTRHIMRPPLHPKETSTMCFVSSLYNGIMLAPFVNKMLLLTVKIIKYIHTRHFMQQNKGVGNNHHELSVLEPRN